MANLATSNMPGRFMVGRVSDVPVALVSPDARELPVSFNRADLPSIARTHSGS